MTLSSTAQLQLPLFWRRSTVSSVFFGRFPWSSLHSVIPFPVLITEAISPPWTLSNNEEEDQSLQWQSLENLSLSLSLSERDRELELEL